MAREPDELGESVPTPEELDALSPEEYQREVQKHARDTPPSTHQCVFCDRRKYPSEGPSASKRSNRDKPFGPPYNRFIPGASSGPCLDCAREHKELMRRHGMMRGDRLFHRKARGMSHMHKRVPYGDPRDKRPLYH